MLRTREALRHKPVRHYRRSSVAVAQENFARDSRLIPESLGDRRFRDCVFALGPLLRAAVNRFVAWVQARRETQRHCDPTGLPPASRRDLSRQSKSDEARVALFSKDRRVDAFGGLAARAALGSDAEFTVFCHPAVRRTHNMRMHQGPTRVAGRQPRPVHAVSEPRQRSLRART